MQLYCTRAVHMQTTIWSCYYHRIRRYTAEAELYTILFIRDGEWLSSIISSENWMIVNSVMKARWLTVSCCACCKYCSCQQGESFQWVQQKACSSVTPKRRGKGNAISLDPGNGIDWQESCWAQCSNNYHSTLLQNFSGCSFKESNVCTCTWKTNIYRNFFLRKKTGKEMVV